MLTLRPRRRELLPPTGDIYMVSPDPKAASLQLPAELDPLLAFELLRAQAGSASFRLLDLRSWEEHEVAHIDGDELLDMHELGTQAKLAALPRATAYLLYCGSGNHSSMVADQMRQLGFGTVSRISGGLKRWIELGLPVKSGH